MADDKQILLLAKKNPDQAEPTSEDLFALGTLATILQLLKLPDGTVKVLVEGGRRASIESLLVEEDYIRADIALHAEPEMDGREGETLSRTLLAQFEQYVQASKKVPEEVLSSLSSIDDPSRLVDTIAAQMTLSIKDKQGILEALTLRERMDLLLEIMDAEIDALEMEKRVRGRVKKQMEQSQREYYLNEQMKAIQKEMGEGEQGEAEELQRRIDESGMPKEAKEKAESELNKLKLMAPMSAEATVVRSYLDWVINIPWAKKSLSLIHISEPTRPY